MKKLLNRIVGAVGAASLLCATQAHAVSGAFLTSFYVTNVISAGAAGTVFGYPTNGTGPNTNGYFVGTGQAAYVGTEDSYGILFQGYLVTTNTNANTFSLTLVSAMSQSQPLVVTGTNIWSGGVTNYQQMDFENTRTNGNLVFQFVTGTNALGGGTNWINFQTNISSAVAPAASYLGVLAITNNMSTGSFLTNLYIGVNQKYKISPFGP